MRRRPVVLRSCLSSTSALTSLLALVFMPTTQAICQQSKPVLGTHVTFVSRGFEPTLSDYSGNAPHNISLTGHIFMIVTVDTRSGPKEDTFGFYPAGKGKGLIKGPGALQSEYRCDPCETGSVAKHFGAINGSVEIGITDQQVKNLFTEVRKWNSKGYDLLDQNCVTFVDSAVKALGYPSPGASLRTPSAYMAALKVVIAAETQRRQQIELQRIAEKQRAEEVKREADAIPLGWVSCGCPSLHQGYGKVINGILYHGPDIRCPK